MPSKAVFLDRDGVLNAAVVKNGKPYPPQSVSEVVIPEDVLSALTLLKENGYTLIGATNQPDVARGATTKETVEAINQYLMDHLPLDEIRVCFHDDCDGCQCRKPLPGLLTQAARECYIDLKESYMIGDRWKDIAAGQEAGCKTIWLNYQYAEKSPEKAPSMIVTSLSEAATWIVGKLKTKGVQE